MAKTEQMTMQNARAKDGNLSNTKLHALAILKFAAMLLIVWWHIGMPNNTIDWGARMCEFLFVASGFLVGYNYYHKGMPNTIDYCFSYTYGKVKKVWPLHVICLLLFMLLNYKTHILGFTWKTLPEFLSNLFLLQAWSPDIGHAFSYNGVSWFLSALFFCYLISPLLIRFIKSKKIAIVSFVLIAVIRISIDIYSKNFINIYFLSTHTSPIVRSMEFAMGMMLVPVFFWTKDKLSRIKCIRPVATIVELGLLVALFFLMKTFNNSWERSYFVLVFCVVVFVFAFDFGYMSLACSNKYVQAASSIQLEVYLFQIVVGLAIDKFFGVINVQIGEWYLFVTKIVLLIVVAVLYKMFLEKRLSTVMGKLGNKVVGWFE